MILDNLGGPKNYDPNLYQKKREELLKILPTDQSQLPPRRMIDSYDSAIIPIASDPVLRVIIKQNKTLFSCLRAFIFYHRTNTLLLMEV